MKTLMSMLALSALVAAAAAQRFFPQQFGQPQPQQFAHQPQPQPQPQQETPRVTWGRCPALEPSAAEKAAKAAVVERCLAAVPLPASLDGDNVEQHRAEVSACALRQERWFTAGGRYDYAKALAEIRAKRLAPDLAAALAAHHHKCRAESQAKYTRPDQIVDQVQLYQACMDYHVSDTCGIRIVGPQ